MNDKAIRKILITLIQAENDKVRIFQEKSIGSSVCDVMAVSEQLTGYEIKSDRDNYQRLSQQVSAYNMFFDYNYIVLGERRLEGAKSRVPDFWGIISVCEDNIRIHRKAKINPSVCRRRQLSILWKIELKNILMKNNLPLYAQKDKGFISDRIAELVDSELLGRQIACELMERDYSIYDAQDYTIRSEQSSYYRSGFAELIDTMSEEDFEDFTLDKWIALYHKAKEIQQKKETVVEAIKDERVPHVIPYTDIEPALGAPWISKNIINDFLNMIVDSKYNSACAEYEAVSGGWYISNKNYFTNMNSTSKYGIPRFNAAYIIEATLNLREIKLFDNGTQYNELDTIAVLEKQKLIIDTFKKWIWEDEDRIWEVEEAYNKMFSGLTKPVFDGSTLKFPELNPDFELYPYQKDAVQRIISEKNTLLAFDVGAGKTYIMIAAAMKMRQEGISRKNMFVVPNNIVGQWEKMFTDLYPEAKVLTVEPKSFKPELRKKVLAQVRDGDYDGIIIAYSCFEMIPLSEQYVSQAMEESIMRIDMAVKGIVKYGWNKKEIEREKNYIRKLTSDFLKSMDAEMNVGITFETIEINTLFIDEAHNFKNIPIRTKLRNLNGINTRGSRKCLEVMQKIRCVQDANGGRGVVLASGTPLCNSISDAYAMQMYLQYDEPEKRHLHIFDNWVKTFAMPEQLCEIDVDTSKFRFIRRFSKFYNLPELSLLFSQCAVFHAIDKKEGLPDFGGYSDVVIKKNPALSLYMQKLCNRTERIRAKKVDIHTDNMLKVSTDGRKAALDLTLVGAEQKYDETSKVYRCADNIMEIYRDFPGCSQLVFCDYSTPKGEKFSVYAELKAHLVQSGVPAKEIAFVHSYCSEQRKLELYHRINEGKVRILIGSTFKLGIGANVQTKLKAIHHLDVPWRPADMVQREGRILRRGNENKEVFIYRYIAEGSFDAYSWQILETKQKFISQFLSGSSYQRSVSDLEANILTYAEVKALALSTPLMKMLAEKENELRNLHILEAQYNASKDKLRRELEEIDMNIPDIQVVRDTERYLEQFDNATYVEMFKTYRDTFSEENLHIGQGPFKDISILEFKVKNDSLPEKGKLRIVLSKNAVNYQLEMGTSAQGNIRRIINFFKKFGKTVSDIEARAEKLKERRADISDELKKDAPYFNNVCKCERELDELRRLVKETTDQ